MDISARWLQRFCAGRSAGALHRSPHRLLAISRAVHTKPQQQQRQPAHPTTSSKRLIFDTDDDADAALLASLLTSDGDTRRAARRAQAATQQKQIGTDSAKLIAAADADGSDDALLIGLPDALTDASFTKDALTVRQQREAALVQSLEADRTARLSLAEIVSSHKHAVDIAKRNAELANTSTAIAVSTRKTTVQASLTHLLREARMSLDSLAKTRRNDALSVKQQAELLQESTALYRSLLQHSYPVVEALQSLLTLYATHGHAIAKPLDEVEQVMAETLDDGRLKLDIGVYNNLLLTYSRHGAPQRAFQLFNTLTQQRGSQQLLIPSASTAAANANSLIARLPRLHTDRFTYGIVIDALCSNGDLATAEQLYQSMCSSDSRQLRPTPNTVAVMATGMARAGEVSRALTLVHNSYNESARTSPSLAMRASTVIGMLNSVIATIAKGGSSSSADDIEKVLKQMRLYAGVAPDGRTVMTLIKHGVAQPQQMLQMIDLLERVLRNKYGHPAAVQQRHEASHSADAEQYDGKRWTKQSKHSDAAEDILQLTTLERGALLRLIASNTSISPITRNLLLLKYRAVSFSSHPQHSFVNLTTVSDDKQVVKALLDAAIYERVAQLYTQRKAGGKGRPPILRMQLAQPGAEQHANDSSGQSTTDLKPQQPEPEYVYEDGAVVVDDDTGLPLQRTLKDRPASKDHGKQSPLSSKPASSTNSPIDETLASYHPAIRVDHPATNTLIVQGGSLTRHCLAQLAVLKSRFSTSQLDELLDINRVKQLTIDLNTGQQTAVDINYRILTTIDSAREQLLSDSKKADADTRLWEHDRQLIHMHDRQRGWWLFTRQLIEQQYGVRKSEEVKSSRPTVDSKQVGSSTRVAAVRQGRRPVA